MSTSSSFYRGLAPHTPNPYDSLEHDGALEHSEPVDLLPKKQEGSSVPSDTTSRAATVVSTSRAFSPDLSRPVRLVNSSKSRPEGEKKEEKVEARPAPKSLVTPSVTLSARPPVVQLRPLGGTAHSGATPPGPTKPSSTLVVSTMPPPVLSPRDIHAQLNKAGSNSDVLAVWTQHKDRFDTENYCTIFANFCQLQSKKRGANDSYAPTLKGMVKGVVDCINRFKYRPLSATIGSLNNIECKGKKLLQIFEKFIMRNDAVALANFDETSISFIAASYAYHKVSSEQFLLVLNKNLGSARAMGTMLKSFSVLGLKSAFKTAQAKITEKGASLLKEASLETIATMSHALITSSKDARPDLEAIEEAIMRGSKSDGCMLSAWVKDAKVGAHFSKILHAFAKQGAGSAELYEAFETALTDEVLATKFEMNDYINVSWALVFAGRTASGALLTMMGMLAEAFEKGAIDLDGTQLEKLRWVKIALTYEQESEFEWGALGDAIDSYLGETSGSATQTHVFTTLKDLYGSESVVEEYAIEGLDVDIFIKGKGKGKNGVAVEVLGPTHYEDDTNCGVLNAQTKFRLRLLTAMLGKDNVATISTKQWSTQRKETIQAIQKQIA